MAKYKPLSVHLIDEGQFLHSVNLDLLAAQETLVEFVRQYGDAASGAKCKISVDIVLSCADTKTMIFGVKATTKTTTPARPASVTAAIAEQTQDGQQCLFVRCSGSDETTPRQGKLCTKSGNTIDAETGEVRSE